MILKIVGWEQVRRVRISGIWMIRFSDVFCLLLHAVQQGGHHNTAWRWTRSSSCHHLKNDKWDDDDPCLVIWQIRMSFILPVYISHVCARCAKWEQIVHHTHAPNCFSRKRIPAKSTFFKSSRSQKDKNAEKLPNIWLNLQNLVKFSSVSNFYPKDSNFQQYFLENFSFSHFFYCLTIQVM